MNALEDPEIVNTAASPVDLLGALLIQVPATALVRNAGRKTHWGLFCPAA